MKTYIDRVKQGIQALNDGKMIILVDHPDRENEGDVIVAAEKVTPEIVNFMLRHGSGIVCLSMVESQVKRLGLTNMVSPHDNSSSRGTPFLVSIEAKEGVTTGVSAADRAVTILTAMKDDAIEQDLVKPGHVFPLLAREGGVLERSGHTEGSVDLMKIANLKPAAVICELMNTDGTMTRGSQLIQFAKEHDLPVLSIDDIISYRMATEDLIAEQVTAQLPLDQYGQFDMTVIKEKYTGMEHVVLFKQPIDTKKPVLVRLHSSCMTGDLFGSKRCDCNQQLNYALKRIGEEGGVLFYLNQEGRGIGLLNKIKAYALQEQGLDTIEANQKLGVPVDSRKYNIAANVLRNWGIDHIRLLTNNPAKLQDLYVHGITQVEREPIPVFCNEHNRDYLQAKKDKLNHLMELKVHG